MKRVPRALVCLILVASACAAAPGGDAADGEIVVLAAASLTEAFTEIAEGFEAAHPGTAVRLSFGPSDGLATQIEEGAPADAFASASEHWTDEVAAGLGVTRRAVFARNELVIVTPSGDPASVRGIEDLADPGVALVLAAPGVPAGDYAREALANAGVDAEANVVSNERDVKGVVQKVFLGEADAGIVYRTDVTEAVAPGLRVVEMPEEAGVVATYSIAVVAGTDRPEDAARFVAYVLDEGQSTLGEFGFLPP